MDQKKFLCKLELHEDYEKNDVISKDTPFWSLPLSWELYNRV